MPKLLLVFVLVVTALLSTSCGQTSISDRDSRREQLRASAEVKRRELELVAGEYQGKLSQASGVEQNIILKLEIKDIPISVEGQVDPVPTPILTGFVRFYFGTDEQSEYIIFSVQKADFEPNKQKLDLIVENAEYKQIIFSFLKEKNSLDGSWSAPSFAASGKVFLTQKKSPGN